MNARSAFCLIFACSIAPISYGATLQSVVIQNTPEKTSIFCTLNQMPIYRGFMLTSPHRAVIDFQKTTSNINLKQIAAGYGPIRLVRMGHPDPYTLRLVFDLQQAENMKIVNWKSGTNASQGLRIELTPKILNHNKTIAIQHPPKNIPSFRNIPPKVAPPSHPLSKPSFVRHAPPKTLRDIIVVIDAGHGGKDPGAIGPRRNQEKNVVLNIALKLQQLINRQAGMRAVLTRRGDYFIGLRERLNIARRYNADVFVAIHADAFNNTNSTGASVYALSPRGATSEAARWLAEKENNSELGGVNLSGLDDRNGLIRTVLLDLSQTATISASLHIGGRILNQLNHITTLHHNKVEQARFVVLKSPDIPSILVETGFISNPREEYNLKSDSYQTKLAYAIFNGLKLYFWEHPPYGTRIEAMTGGNTHLVQNEPSTSKWRLFNPRGKTV